ncbi:MAG: ribosome maturation factor RimP [Myxococcota bacterium]
MKARPYRAVGKWAGRPLFLFVGSIAVYRDIPESLRALIEPVVEDWGFELMDAILARGRQPWHLRVTIDTPQGDGRVPVERCAEISRELGTHLDAANAVPVSYRLEVSSPGLDRMLAREKDFVAACGSDVQIETRRPLDGRRRFRGRLLEFHDGVAKLNVDSGAVAIEFQDVLKANTVYEFTAADFARRQSGTPAAERRLHGSEVENGRSDGGS